MENEIKIVIGSWGSYNAYNERALGSEWLTLGNFESWEEIEEELTQEGFLLNGIDEELFIQDIEGLEGFNCDNMHPKTLFNICKEANILNDVHKYKTALAYIEAMSWEDFERLVNNEGSRWDDNVYFYKNMSVEEALEEMVNNCYNLNFKDLGWLANYITIDYESMAHNSYNYYDTKYGAIEIN